MKDLFIRRAYKYKDIVVVVEIDLVQGQISLVQQDFKGQPFKPKQWLFAERELEYMQGWLNILEAMQYAIKEASKVLKEHNDQDVEEFTKLLVAAHVHSLKKEKKNAKKT